jgi:uncharacterized protein YndB with AHSA1/START domain
MSSIVLARASSATAVSIYAALTTTEGLRAFWTPSADAASQVGDSLRFGFAEAPVDLTMKLAAADPGERVHWSDVAPWPTWSGTDVSWLILDDGESRTVVFRHAGFADDVSDVELGMIAMTWADVLRALDGYATSGDPQPALG